jgi:hypothetical protein
MAEKPEDKARKTIDQLLAGAGWTIQDSDEANVAASRGVAIREFPLKSGYAQARVPVPPVAQPVAQPLLAVQRKEPEPKEHRQDPDRSGQAACTTKKPMTFYRRNLPHWHPPGRAIFLTWRLFGSLPKGTGKSACTTSGTATPGCATSKGTGQSASATESGRRFRVSDAELDRGAYGPTWLRDPKIAGYVEEAIIRGEELGQYTLHAYVVMPNHVHLLLQPLVPLARITGGIKGGLWA